MSGGGATVIFLVLTASNKMFDARGLRRERTRSTTARQSIFMCHFIASCRVCRAIYNYTIMNLRGPLSRCTQAGRVNKQRIIYPGSTSSRPIANCGARNSYRSMDKKSTRVICFMFLAV